MNCYFQQRYFRIYISVFAMILALLVGCDRQRSDPSITSVEPPDPTETVVPTPEAQAPQVPIANDPTVELPDPTETVVPTPEAQAPKNFRIARAPQVADANDPAIVLKQAIKNLKPGQIVFDVPQSMQVSNAQLVEVRLSDDLQRNLKVGLNEKSEVAQIKVSPFMKARLEGLNFTIKSLTEESQALVAGDMIQWRWSVTPTELGEQKLFLSLYARIKISNQPEEVVSLKTFERSINVAVSPTNWLGQNGKGFLDTAIALSSAGFFAFALTRWRWMRKVLKKKTFKS